MPGAGQEQGGDKERLQGGSGNSGSHGGSGDSGVHGGSASVALAHPLWPWIIVNQIEQFSWGELGILGGALEEGSWLGPADTWKTLKMKEGWLGPVETWKTLKMEEG